MSRVLVGIPTQWGLWRAAMGLSLARAVASTQHQLIIAPKNGPYLGMNREACMTDAIEAKAEFLVFVDTDIGFPADALDRLVAHGKDVIGANYYEKRLPLVSTIKPLVDGALVDDGRTIPYTMPHEPFQCAALGAGLLAIRVSRVRDCMAPPYFSIAEHKGEPMGEDIYFCTRARAVGLEVWCDPTIPTVHIGDYAYGAED